MADSQNQDPQRDKKEEEEHFRLVHNESVEPEVLSFQSKLDLIQLQQGIAREIQREFLLGRRELKVQSLARSRREENELQQEKLKQSRQTVNELRNLSLTFFLSGTALLTADVTWAGSVIGVFLIGIGSILYAFTLILAAINELSRSR